MLWRINWSTTRAHSFNALFSLSVKQQQHSRRVIHKSSQWTATYAHKGTTGRLQMKQPKSCDHATLIVELYQTVWSTGTSTVDFDEAKENKVSELIYAPGSLVYKASAVTTTTIVNEQQLQVSLDDHTRNNMWIRMVTFTSFGVFLYPRVSLVCIVLWHRRAHHRALFPSLKKFFFSILYFIYNIFLTHLYVVRCSAALLLLILRRIVVDSSSRRVVVSVGYYTTTSLSLFLLLLCLFTLFLINAFCHYNLYDFVLKDY